MSLPTIRSAHGVHLVDTDGKEYIDGSSGVLNVNLGHRPAAVLDAISRQLQQVTFVHRSQFRSEPSTDLTRELLEIAPAGAGHVEYSNSGSEANETALRVALAHHHRRGEPRRTLVLSEHPGYHGMTAGALAVTGQPAKRDSSSAALAANGTVGPAVRPRPGRLRAGAGEWSAVLDEVGRHRVAAVLLEPVGGSATGAAPVSDDTLRWLRAEADRHGFLLIADEVMSGFGRTGRWWGCDHAGVAPDLLTSGKGLTCGLTSLAVTFVARHIIDSLAGEDLGAIVLGHTMSGNPLASATCLAVLRHLRTHDIPGRARTMGTVLRTGLDDLRESHPSSVTEVRGRGLMLGLGLAGDPDRPLAATRRLVELARANGLVVCPGGSDGTTESVLVAPPLTITDTELAQLLDRLRNALDDLAGSGRSSPPASSDRS